MKQCNYLKHLILLVLCALTLNVTAHEFEAVNSDGVTIWYNITSDNSVEVTYRGSSYDEYSGEYSGEVNIPSTVEYSGNTYSVTAIGENAFSYCDGLTSVTIPESVTAIGMRAFNGCDGLTGVYISNLTAWCNIDFSDGVRNNISNPLRTAKKLYLNNELITDLVIPNSISEIKEYTFYGCSSLISVTIPEGVTSIGSYAFSSCDGLTSVTISEGVTAIEMRAFSGCDGLTSVTIPESVTSIGSSAFSNCAGLTSVTIPESVTSIGYGAFLGCTGLTSVTIPEGVTSIGDNAFSNCDGLTEIEVAENNTNYSSEEGVLFNKDKTELIQYPIGNSRTSYSIPESVTAIGDDAFLNCDGLTSVTIPESVTSIEGSAFYNCSGLTEIEVAENNTNYSSEEGVLFNKYKTELIQYPKGNSRTSYSIPEGVTSIGSSAFSFCDGLTSVTIPESVTSIGDAFLDCTGLTEIYSLNPVAPTIYSATFYNVPKIIPVYIPKGSLSSYQSAEYWSKFTNFVEIKEIYTISVSSSDEGMGSATASETEVEEGTTVTLTATPKDGYKFTNWTLGGEVVSTDNPYQATITANSEFVANFEALPTSRKFEAVNSDGVTIWYNITSDNSVEVTYKGSSYNEYSREYSGEVNIPSTVEYSGNTYSVTAIGMRAFSDCYGLTSVTIPESVTSIGRYAFYYCSGLTSVTIPEGVTAIGNYAFRYCSGLTSVTIPNSVTTIGDDAFSNCDGLTEIEVAENNTNYSSEEGVLFNKDKTELIQYPIGNSRTSYSIPEGVTSIGYNAFFDCDGLTSVTISEGVTSIGSSAFRCCDGLTSVTIPESVTIIGGDAFLGCTGLTEIEVVENNTNYSSEEGVLFNKDKTKLIQYPIGNSRTSYSIPESVTSIGRSAFSDCYGLTSVTIPESVTSIGSSAFYRCTGLTSVTIPEGVSTIGVSAFFFCYGLTSVVIPNSVTSIGGSAFRYCYGLTSVTIPEGVTSIGDDAFRDCTGLTEIYSLNPTAPTIYSSTFANVPKTIPVYIPKGSLSSYQSTEYWSEFTNFVEINKETGFQDNNIPSHEQYVSIGSEKAWYQAYQNWTPGTPLYNGTEAAENEQFFISRVKPRERFTFTATQVDETMNPERKLLWWCPIGSVNNGNWNALPSYWFGGEVYSMWSYTDTYGNWTAPMIQAPAAFLDVCHKNGVRSGVVASVPYGTAPSSSDGGHGSNINALVNGGSEKLLKYLRYYGVDGIGFNSEFSWQYLKPTDFKVMMGQCYANADAYGVPFNNAWYSFTSNGGTSIGDYSYLDRGCVEWFHYNGKPVSDAYFLNYNWGSSQLSTSQSTAAGVGRLGFDVYAGMDYQGRSSAAWTALQNYNISIGIWGAHNMNMIYESRGELGATPEQQQKTYQLISENSFTGSSYNPVNTPAITDILRHTSTATDFHGFSSFITARSTLMPQYGDGTLADDPFVTYFNLGNGKFFKEEGVTTFNQEWYNLGMQDYLPTWRWWWTKNFMGKNATDASTDMTAEFTWEDAWFGGSSLQITGATDMAYLQLFKTKYPVENGDLFTIRYKVVSGSGKMSLTASTESAPKTEISSIIKSTMVADELTWQVKTIKVATRGGLKLGGETLALMGLKFENTTSDFKVLIGEISLTRGTSITPGMPAIVSSKTMARNYKGVDVKVVFDMTAHDKNSSGRQSYQSIYNSDVNTWYYKIYTQQEGGGVVLCTSTTSWAAYVVGAPYDLEKGGRIRVGVSAVSLDGKSESAISWGEYMSVPANTTVEGFSIDKPIIKAGEKFTVAFDDPTHAAATWVIKASDNDAVKYSTTANKFTTSLSEEGIYDLYLTMNGVTEIYRGKIQISPAEVGALPQINQIKINGEEVNTDEIICLGTPKEITISYTGSESTTIAPSRGLALCEKAFGIPTEQLGFNDYTPFTLTFWINFNSFNHEQDGTQFLNIRSAADKWPASDWGYIWSTITVQDQDDNAGNKYNEGNLMFHYRNSNYAGVPVPTSTEFVFKPQTWYHVAMICGYENTRRTFSLYINGKLVGEVAEEALYPWKSSNVIMIGGRAYRRAAIDGTLDEVRLYKKALTASEVKGSMQHQSSSVTDSDFIGYWDFESEAQSDNTMKSIGYNKNLVSGTYEIKTISEGNNQYIPQSILFAQGAPFISGTNYQIETKPIWDIEGGSLVSESGDGSSGEAVIEYTDEDKGFNKVSLTLDNGWGSITKTIKLSYSFDAICDEYLAVTSADKDMGTAEIIEGPTMGDSNDFYAVIGATPKDGYKFTNWTLGGEVVSTDNPYTITSMSNTEYVANFKALPIYTIGVSSSDNTKGTAESSSNTKYEGATVTLTATPNDGYKFTNWTLGGEVVSIDNPYQATITANSEFVANFEEEVRYKTIVQTNNEDWGSVNINGEDGVTEKWILAGNSVTVNAIPEAGYEFVEWSIVMSGMTFPVGGASASYTIPELTADMTLKATFRLTPVPVTSINLSESTVEIRQEKELQLTATLLPNNATNKEVLWSSEDIGIATVDRNGNVTAVSEGTTRIIISAQDGSGVTAECEVTVLPILKGDSNDNEMVTVTDAVNTTNYVAGKEVSVFNYNAADVNSDSNITISDVSGTISIVMAQPIEMLSMQSSIMKNSVSDYLLTDDFVLEGNTPQEVSIKMDNSINYTALQADITTGEGLSICGITLGARADASHRLQTSQLTSSTTRVVIYSLQNRSFKNIDDTLINLQIDSEEGATGDISVSNIYASDNQAQEYILQAIGGANITPTSIQETERQTSSIYSVKGGVIITNSVSKKVSIYSSTGMLIKELYTQSEIEKIELNKGLYIVVVGEKTEKVIVE